MRLIQFINLILTGAWTRTLQSCLTTHLFLHINESMRKCRSAALPGGLSGLILAGLITSAVAQEDPGTKQPQTSFMPRKETQAIEFLDKYPDFDGRGVVVAIFDTGVDPTAEGMQITPDGEPKVIDIIDATGSGDVDMSVTASPDANGVLNGLSGRKLTISSDWPEADGSYHIGLKNGFDLFPGPAIRRYKALMKKEREHRTRQRIRDLKVQLQNPDQSGVPSEEVEARIEALEKMLQDYDPAPPFYDCVLFRSGDEWLTVIDSDRDGDLRDEQLMREFDRSQDVGRLENDLGVAFGVHVYENGNILSIVTESGAHGTHVAGIVAGYYPAKPDFNGVAPGARIVSVKIGDNRLDGMETMTAMERALPAVVRHKCDLINMSYGEPTTLPDQGRIIEMIHHTVREENIVFVASAGNSGPALYTVGAPGGTTGPVFAIGAYVSPAMASEQYGYTGEIPETFYTWSSRGPTFDGDIGVDFAAPGGAYAPVPRWSEVGKQQMNGTSMASPNACGNIALILSGLKNRGIQYTPARIHRALAATARKLPDSSRFAQGHGLVQTLDAFHHLEEHAAVSQLNMPLDIRVRQSDSSRGIQMIVDPSVPDSEHTWTVDIQPWFSVKASLEDRLTTDRTLTFRSPHPWIRVPELAVLQSRGVDIRVSIDLENRQLPSPFFAEIDVMDTAFPEAGPVARIPVTILSLKGLDSDESGSMSVSGGGPFEAGQIERTFVRPPHWAQWAEVEIRRTDEGDDTRRFQIHAVQRIPGRHYRHNQFNSWFMVSPERQSRRFQIVGGVPMEIALASYWSVSQATSIEWTIHFLGEQVYPDPLVIEGNQGMTQVTVHPSPDGRRLTVIEPSGSLKKLRRTLKPSKSRVSPMLDVRDEQFDGRIMHEIIIEYPLSLEKDTSVQPLIPAFQDRLYEMELSSQLWEIRNKSGFRYVSDDTFPSPVSLMEGDYTLYLHFRHPDPGVLEKAGKMPVAIEMPVSNVGLKFFKNPDDWALRGRGGYSATLESGDAPVQFFAGVDFESGIPDDARPGDVLFGDVRWIKDNPATIVDESHPSTHAVFYTIPISSGPASGNGSGMAESMESALRRTRIDYLRSIPEQEDEKFRETAETMLEDDPHWLEVMFEKLQRIDNGDRKTHLDEIVSLCSRMEGLIDTESMERLLFVPEKFLSDDEKKKRKDAMAHKDMLVDVLYRKCRAIAYIEDKSAEESESGERTLNPDFDDAFQKLSMWVDTTEKEYVLVHIRDLRRKGRQGEGLRILAPFLRTQKAEDIRFHRKKLRLLEELEWTEWIETQNREILKLYPVEDQVRF